MALETDKIVVTGGCLCGAVRYRIVGVAKSIGHCHCNLCQKASGAAFVTWATYATNQLTFIQSQPNYFVSSATGKRGFCSSCGTALVFSSSDYPDEVDVTVCSMDCPDNLSPDYHIWTASKRSWIHLNDGLRSYIDAGPDVPSNHFKF
ncbi:MAG: GFA family protein [Richelia sp. CSU_2_1]|nr:GFA family protein [Richelia sp. CSU_2_1]